MTAPEKSGFLIDFTLYNIIAIKGPLCKKKSISKLKAFVPSWPSVIMGTGALTIALSLSSKIIPAINYLVTGSFVPTMPISLMILALVYIPGRPRPVWAGPGL